MRKNASPVWIVSPAILFLCFLLPSFYGLNFGAHWDEVRAKFDSVRESVRTGVFTQASGDSEAGENYNYGGVNYLLTWTGFAPEIARFLSKGPLTRAALSEVISPVIYGIDVRLRVRAIYLVLSSLSILWLYLLNRVLGRSRLETFMGAAFLAGSWEVAYHSRWIAPDVVMMQFAVLSFLCLTAATVYRQSKWLYLGAIAIGLTAGTKYPGAIVLPFFLVGAGHVSWRMQRSAAGVLKRCLSLGGTTALVFAITTPGVLLDPFRFFNQLREQHDIYATGWFGYTVRPGLQHFIGMLRYFTLQIFSHYWTVSIAVSVFCVIGIVCLLSERRLLFYLMTGFSLTYMLFFSQQAAMMVRNLLAVVPFLCLAAARGVTVVRERLSPGLRPVLYAGLGMILACNFGWEIYAAIQVRHRTNTARTVRAFLDYVRKSPEEKVFISAKLLTEVRGFESSLPGNVVTNAESPHSKVALLQTEGPDVHWDRWPSNRWGLYERTFGALEVNLDAYPTFAGNQRILLLDMRAFRKLPIKETDLATP